VADLHALLLAHLDDARTTFEHGNTDGYKVFWNLDAYGRPTKPLPEETCRDRLVDRLRLGLLPLSVTVEPEGHMAHDKRADMMVAMPARKILCELKRDYHSDVWTAAEGQLERFYTPDPDAGGFGVYAVFWFGDKRPSKIPSPPGGKAKPRSAREMEQMLIEMVPHERRVRIAVHVIDVSGATPPIARPKQIAVEKKAKKVSPARKRAGVKKASKKAKLQTKKRPPSKGKKRQTLPRRKRKK
jgi:hypothetical protein